MKIILDKEKPQVLALAASWYVFLWKIVDYENYVRV